MPRRKGQTEAILFHLYLVHACVGDWACAEPVRRWSNLRGSHSFEAPAQGDGARQARRIGGVGVAMACSALT